MTGSLRGRPEEMVVSLEVREPYDWEGLIGFLRARAIPGVEFVGPDEYRRTVALNGSHGVIRVTRTAQTLSLSMPRQLEPAAAVIGERVARMFDLSADAAVIAGRLRRDGLLRPLLKRWPGVRVPGAWDPFELAVRAVIGQQVSVAGATTVIGRLVAVHGVPFENGDGGRSFLFPQPETLAEADISGMPRSRAATIRAVAAAFARGPVDAEGLGALKGIGPWTVNYVAMRAWGDSDAFPAGDLGLRRAAGNLTERELERRSHGWRPWRAYAAMLLWRSL